MEVWEKIAALTRDGVEAVVVTIAAVRGSVPGQVGAKAVVSRDGLIAGNLGGGKVEARAIQQAIDLLQTQESCRFHTWNLQRDIGMTCGGEMTFLFEKVAPLPSWHIAVFGAGHVSQALVPLLATLACRVDVFDPRAEWLARFAPMDRVTCHQIAAFEDGVDYLTPASFLLSITQGHACDRPVLRDALRKFPELPFVGVIGSISKRAVILRELADDGISSSSLQRVHCPIGLAIGGNDPAEISISIAAQLIAVRDG